MYNTIPATITMIIGKYACAFACATVAMFFGDAPTETPEAVTVVARPETIPATETPNFPILFSAAVRQDAPPQLLEDFWQTPGVGFTVEIARLQEPQQQ